MIPRLVDRVAVFTLETPIDSGIGLSIRIDNLRVFINKTLSTDSLINQLLIGVSDNDKCVSVTQW